MNNPTFVLGRSEMKSDMAEKVLGTGYPKCKTLEKLTREVVAKNGIDATITRVEDITTNYLISKTKKS